MFNLERSDETLIVRVSGELDHHIASTLKEEIDQRLKEEIKNIIFDFSLLQFMDSSGIGFLMARYKKIKEKEGVAVIVSPTPQVKRILEMSGIMTIIKIAPDIKRALKIIKR